VRYLLLAIIFSALLPGDAGVAAEEASPSEKAPVCRIDFEDAQEPSRWRIVGDRLMLGRSEGAVIANDGVGEFFGTVRHRIGGGWCSARRAFDPPLRLDDEFRVILEICGDGKTYGFDLRDTKELDGIYWEATLAPPAGEWTTVELAAAKFHPLRRGSPASTDETLDLRSIESAAVVIARGQTGPFSLKIREVVFLHPSS
jgi:hypothetical protein